MKWISWSLKGLCWGEQRWRLMVMGVRWRRAASVMFEGDLGKVQDKFEKRFTRLMREKYGIGEKTCHRFGKPCTSRSVCRVFGVKVRLDKAARVHANMDPKKLKVLSKLLFDSILDLLGSGELIEDTSELQKLQISKVRLSGDLQFLTIHWVGSGTDEDVNTQSLLDQILDPLRDGLLRLDYVGFVPKIQFSRDLSQVQLQELTRLLEKADKGPDHPRLADLQAAYFAESEVEIDARSLSQEQISSLKQLQKKGRTHGPSSTENGDL